MIVSRPYSKTCYIKISIRWYVVLSLSVPLTNAALRFTIANLALVTCNCFTDIRVSGGNNAEVFKLWLHFQFHYVSSNIWVQELIGFWTHYLTSVFGIEISIPAFTFSLKSASFSFSSGWLLARSTRSSAYARYPRTSLSSASVIQRILSKIRLNKWGQGHSFVLSLFRRNL